MTRGSKRSPGTIACKSERYRKSVKSNQCSAWKHKIHYELENEDIILFLDTKTLRFSEAVEGLETSVYNENQRSPRWTGVAICLQRSFWCSTSKYFYFIGVGHHCVDGKMDFLRRFFGDIVVIFSVNFHILKSK